MTKEQQRQYPGGSIRSARWQRIREKVLARANHRCENCGVRDRYFVAKDVDTREWFSYSDEGDEAVDAMRIVDELGGQLVQIILTIAHVNHDPHDNDLLNLKAWCQRCHNRHDAKHRGRNRRRRAWAKKAGGTLFDLGD